MADVLITTVPFAEKNHFPIEMLSGTTRSFQINPFNRKLKEDELSKLIKGVKVLIAGTEPITKKVLDAASDLKHISRVGVGLDNIDLNAARKKGISVSYTPDAPGPAVAELTIGLLISLLRNIHISNIEMHKKQWYRHFGPRIADITLGIIGVGRIGGRVLRRVSAFGTPKILVNDILPNLALNKEFKLEWVAKDEIFQHSDVVSLHVPLTAETRGMVGKRELNLMSRDSYIINTSRGGVVDENALYAALKEKKIAGAAIDVFEEEPYDGKLSELPSCILTSHMGSMSIDCRTRMEIEATEEAVRFLQGRKLQSIVPEEEYLLQKSLRSIKKTN